MQYFDTDSWMPAFVVGYDTESDTSGDQIPAGYLFNSEPLLEPPAPKSALSIAHQVGGVCMGSKHFVGHMLPLSENELRASHPIEYFFQVFNCISDERNYGVKRSCSIAEWQQFRKCN